MNSRRLLLWMGALLGVGVCLSPATALAQRHAADVQVSPPDAQVQVGRQAPFVATAYDNANSPIATATFDWSSSNPRAATIDQNGIATGVGPGVTIITARTGTGRYAKSGQATLQVVGEGAQPQPQAAGQPAVARGAVPAGAGRGLAGPGCAAADREPPGSGPPVGLMVEPLRVSLVRGESKALAYRPVQGSGDPADHLCVQFAIQAGGEKVAAVDSFGVVMASDTGHAVVQVTVPGKTFPPRYVAVEVRSDSVRWRAHEISMVPGAVDTLQLVVPAQGGRPINAAGIFQFVSSDTTKVRVAPLTAIVTALAAGSARVIAQSSIYPDIPITINVHRRVARVVGTPADTIITLAIGAQTAMTARPLAADSSLVAEVPVTWTVSDTTVARYDTVAKVLRGLKMGEIFVRVSAPVVNDSLKVLTWRVKVIAGGLAITRPGPKVVLGVGERTPVEVKLLDDKRQPIETASRLTWTSSSDSVARVADGQIVATGMGRARVTARSAWDSTVAADVTVVGDLLVYALRQGRWDLYMLQRQENGQPPMVRQLTQDTTVKSSPAWSPTLAQIAFVASASLSWNSDLYILDFDSGAIRRLTHDSATVRSPSFVGPGGDQIVFESSKTGKAQIYVMKTDGTGRRQLTQGDVPNTQPDVSPDGRKVVYASVRDRNYDIFEMNLDGTGERRLATSPRQEDSPAYAADGRWFYYLRDDGGNPLTKRVYRQDLVSGAATPVTPVGLFVQAFSVSADSSTLALLTLSADANGVQTAKVVLFNVATGAMTPMVLPGADRIAGPAFRPAAPQH
ncbi:MAG TPA: Ig-like domain-containing protein [Gemmatimonadales bacterium]|nr:Ig-like domain-containing protein [Gemmatimonadales bacterium]